MLVKVFEILCFLCGFFFKHTDFNASACFLDTSVVPMFSFLTLCGFFFFFLHFSAFFAGNGHCELHPTAAVLWCIVADLPLFSRFWCLVFCEPWIASRFLEVCFHHLVHRELLVLSSFRVDCHCVRISPFAVSFGVLLSFFLSTSRFFCAFCDLFGVCSLFHSRRDASSTRFALQNHLRLPLHFDC